MQKIIVLLLCVLAANAESTSFFSIKNLRSYARFFHVDRLIKNETGNELWNGLFRDCDKSVSFSCIQRNAYSYLDNVFIDRDNITVFDGLTLKKNSLDYGTCRKSDSLNENLVEESDDCDEGESEEEGRGMDEEQTPLEEVTGAIGKKAVKFLATRDYEIQLPEFFFEGAAVKISPKEVDETGALIRVDFGQRALEKGEGRIFKKIRKFIQNKLLTSLLALLLIIKLIKLKFMFVIPFLFGIGTAKKLFLKLLLFFIPAFAHVFKLCSSYYSSHTKYHHHHHQIAHHHHHVPVPVPVPAYYPHHHHHHEDDLDTYDYAHPHIQYRKDMEELREWGIEPYEEPDDAIGAGGVPIRGVPGPGVLQAPYPSPGYPGGYGAPQYAANAPQITPTFPDKRPLPAHNLPYSAYIDNNRRQVVQPASPAISNPNNPIVNVPANPVNPNSIAAAALPVANGVKSSYGVFAQNTRQISAKSSQVEAKPGVATQRQDEFYGPIVNRLEEIFKQLRFFEETCRERLICSMYKNPAVYSPHSNLVSNELSRDPQELKKASGTESSSSQKFHRYLNAARLGQDGGDCLRMYPCHINTE
ncbi:DUF1676 domain-containing protein Osi17 [Lasioglossum baleicum]|uniref:DUF1676 domain-containing protein Osi17 n=1 Tax=Lasioglossum baleicum TaxID=434251 RepID=UPI003FCD3CE9